MFRIPIKPYVIIPFQIRLLALRARVPPSHKKTGAKYEFWTIALAFD